MIRFEGKIKNMDKFIDDVKQGNVWKHVQEKVNKPTKMSLKGIVELVKSIHPDTLINKDAKEYLLDLYKKGSSEEQLKELIHLGAINARLGKRKIITLEDFKKRSLQNDFQLFQNKRQLILTLLKNCSPKVLTVKCGLGKINSCSEFSDAIDSKNIADKQLKKYKFKYSNISNYKKSNIKEHLLLELFSDEKDMDNKIKLFIDEKKLDDLKKEYIIDLFWKNSIDKKTLNDLKKEYVHLITTIKVIKTLFFYSTSDTFESKPRNFEEFQNIIIKCFDKIPKTQEIKEFFHENQIDKFSREFIPFGITGNSTVSEILLARFENLLTIGMSDFWEKFLSYLKNGNSHKISSNEPKNKSSNKPRRTPQRIKKYYIVY